MGAPNPVPVRFSEQLQREMDAACTVEAIDRSTFIRRSVIEYLAGEKERQPLFPILVNQCEYLQQIARSVGENDLIKQEVERLWDIVQWLKDGQYAK